MSSRRPARPSRLGFTFRDERSKEGGKETGREGKMRARERRGSGEGMFETKQCGQNTAQAYRRQNNDSVQRTTHGHETRNE